MFAERGHNRPPPLTYVDNISYEDEINHEIQIEKIKGLNKILWKVFFNTKLHLEISLPRSKIKKYFFRIKYFENFLYNM